MWILEDESDQRYYPSPSKPFIIGRNQGDLIAKSDGSISRSHAKIEIFSCLEKCQVTDTKSKYGTFLMDNNNQVLMQIKDVYTIQPNDRIRFGLQNCILTFIQQTFVLLTSSLTREDKEELTEIMAAINGTILEEWNDSCTHLTVSIPKLTAKLVCALAAGVSIVTIDYWRSVKKAKREGNPIPDPSKFCPVLEDSMLLKNETSLLPNPSRKSIFMDFVFIHFRKNQMDTYKKMIELSGGTSVFYGEKSFDKKLLSHSNSRVILYHDDDSQTEPYRVPDVARVKSFLKNNNRRMIPEIEITLAILSASVESCCNPSFSYENLLKNAREKKVVEEGEILAAETQASANRLAGRNAIVPESLIIAETESFGDNDTERSIEDRMGSPMDLISEFPDKKNERKRSRDLENNDTDKNVKKAKAVCMPEENVKKLSQRLLASIKSDNPGTKGKSCDRDNSRGQVLVDESAKESTELRNNILEIPRKMVISNHTNEQSSDGRDDKKNDKIDVEIIKSPVKVVTKSKIYENNGVPENSLPDKNGRSSSFLHVSDDEMEIIQNPTVDDHGEDDTWRELRKESSLVRLLKDSLGDEESMDKSLWRPEVFSGQHIGKKFKKFYRVIPQRPLIEWQRNL